MHALCLMQLQRVCRLQRSRRAQVQQTKGSVMRSLGATGRRRTTAGNMACPGTVGGVVVVRQQAQTAPAC